MTNKSKYFAPKEFKNCTPSCSIDDMAQGFLNTMDALREKAGIPIVINCAYRSQEWETKHNRPGTSSHCKGIAVDIRCNSLQNRFKIVSAALAIGIRRIGIAPTYIHIDGDNQKSRDVMWIYDTSNNQY